METTSRVIALVVFAWVCLPFSAEADPFTIEHGISMRWPVRAFDGRRLYEASPDNKFVAVVTRRGDIARDANVFELILFSVDALQKGDGWKNHLPDAQVVASFESTSNLDAITSARWIDSESIALIGQRADSASQVYLISVRTKAVKQLTHAREEVLSFAMHRSALVYNALESRQSETERRASRESNLWSVVNGVPLTEFMLPQSETGRAVVSFSTWFVDLSKASGVANREQRISAVAKGRRLNMKIWLSPTGREAVVLRVVKSPPTAWGEYVGYSRSSLALGDLNLMQFVNIDLDRRESRALLDAPTGTSFGHYWIPLEVFWRNRGTIVLTGQMLPLDSDSVRPEQAKLSAAIVEFDDRAHRPLRALPLTADDRGGPRGRFETIVHDASLDQLRLERRDSDGKISSFSLDLQREALRLQPTPSLRPGIDIVVSESLNSPPEYAVRVDGSTEQVFTDLNPQLRSLDMGVAEPFAWKDRENRGWKGILLMPPVKGASPPPLVIQTHGAGLNRFFMNGPTSLGDDGVFSAYAARPLAAAGIGVLQMEDIPVPRVNLAQEPQMALEAYRAAIRELSQLGRIDATRVGIIGFSRTCWHVRYALTHAPSLFAAAIVSDGLSMGYFEHLVTLDLSDDWGPYSYDVYGGGPYGAAADAWRREAPTFNLDKVAAPLRIEANSYPSLLGEWEMYAGMRWLHKPVELILYPTGAHQLKKVRERIASQSGTVDWFAFWLSGVEDNTPAKSAQYERWRALKAQH